MHETIFGVALLYNYFHEKIAYIYNIIIHFWEVIISFQKILEIKVGINPSFYKMANKLEHKDFAMKCGMLKSIVASMGATIVLDL